MEADPKRALAAESALPAARSGADNGDDHDLSLIIERLGWTPEQRLDANTAFSQFYLTVRPDGPVITGER
jgi:hypothetical protein